MAEERGKNIPLQEGYRPLAKGYTGGKDMEGGYQPEATISGFTPPEGGSALAPEPPPASPVASGNPGGASGGGTQGDSEK